MSQEGESWGNMKFILYHKTVSHHSLNVSESPEQAAFLGPTLVLINSFVSLFIKPLSNLPSEGRGSNRNIGLLQKACNVSLKEPL